MERIYNFLSAPSTLPEVVVEKIRENISHYGEDSASIFEIGRGNPLYDSIVSEAEALLREIMSIPQNYKIMFLAGGSDAQYSAIPLNILSEHKCADYVISGQLSKNASIEAKKYGDIMISASSAGASPAFSTVPDVKKSDIRPDADYAYVCYNDTIYGTKFYYTPDTGNIPLVADMSSFMLTEPFDITRFALVFADAERGIGVSGLTILIIRDDMISSARADTPSHMNYKNILEGKTAAGTASALSIHVAKLVFEWIKSLGGLEEVKRRNERKASLIYDFLDGQNYYTAPVDKKCRSMMNVVFFTGEPRLDAAFCKEAREYGLINLEGDSSIGGMCASIYNAMDVTGVEALVTFMKKFASENPRLEG
jgi:phosphoserine aminotransferase